MKSISTLFRQLSLIVVLISTFSLSALGAVYEKVTTAPADWSGQYLLVYETEKVAFNGALTTLDATNNYKKISITDNKITIDDTNNNFFFIISATENGYYIKSASGYYIGREANSNELNSNTELKFINYTNTISVEEGIKGAGGCFLKFNSAKDQLRFRYYESGQQPIQFYKLTTDSGEGDSDEQPTEYTVTFNAGTGSCNTKYLSGTEIILPRATPPTVCNQEGWIFVGWSETSISETNNKPNLLYPDNPYYPSTDTTLYAVYKKEEIDNNTTPTYSWILTDINEITPEDRFAITITRSNGKTYELNSTKGTSDDPPATEVTINENKLSIAPVKSTIWTLTKSNDGYTFHPNGDETKWLYCTNTDNGIRVGTNTNKTFTIDSSSGYLKNIATNRYLGIYLGVYNAQYWRCYTSINNNIKEQTLGFYVKKSETPINTTYNSTPHCTTYSATFHINVSDNITITDIVLGTTISDLEGIPTLLNTCNTDFLSFVGWTTNSETLNDYAKPEIVTTITDNVDLYPVFSNAYTQLTTETSQLQINDKIIIVASEYNYALNTNQKQNDRGQVEITKISNKIGLNDSIQIITLQEGSTENRFSFYVETGYLYAASSNANYLRTKSQLDSCNTDWSISIKDSIATIKAKGEYTRNWLQYNNQSNLFSCYFGNTQENISIYKLIDATQWIVCNNSTLSIESNEIYNLQTNISVDNLIVKSNYNNTGQINITNGSIYAHKIVIEKTINDKWNFFSLPFDCNIAEIEAISANGDTLTYAPDASNGNYVIAKYDGTNSWVELLGNNNPSLNANQGYIIGHWYESSNNVTVKFPSNDAQNISAPDNATLTKTSDNGFNLIGLPYFQKVTNADLNATYVSIPNEDGMTYNQIECDAEIIASIAPFTSFFVQTKAENIEFTLGAQQNAAPRLDGRSNQASLHKAVVTLTDANGGADKTTIINNPSKTTDYEIGHDLTKLIGYAEIPQIYSIQGNDILAFNSLAINNETIIPLGVYAHADGDYTFSLSDKSMGNLEGWKLYDSESGKAVALTDESLTVTLSKGTHEGRFSIRMEQGTTTDCECDMSNIVTYMNNGTFYIENMPAKAMVYIYDAVGRMIYATETTDTSFDYTFALRGVYNVVVCTEYNSIAYKTIY